MIPNWDRPDLLKEDINSKEDTKKYVYKLWTDAVEENNPTAEHIRKQYDLAKDKYFEARHVLEDFEAKDW